MRWTIAKIAVFRTAYAIKEVEEVFTAKTEATDTATDTKRITATDTNKSLPVFSVEFLDVFCGFEQ